MEKLQHYQLTVTVSPLYNIHGNRYSRMYASEQWNWIQYRLYEILDKYDVHYAIYPEFTKKFQIHVHGHVIFKHLEKMDIVDIYKKLNIMGRCEFKPAHEYKGWMTYIQKDQKEMSQLKYESLCYNTFLLNNIECESDEE